MQTWKPQSNSDIPDLPPELEERPGVIWLSTCLNAGLSISDLQHLRIDQAEAIIELKSFTIDAASGEKSGKRRMSAKKAQAAFFH